MTIYVKEHATGNVTYLVEQTHDGDGVWFGPEAGGCTSNILVDRKTPIEAERSVVRSMLNESGSYRFSAHYFAATPAAAAVKALTWPRSLPKRDCALYFDDAEVVDNCVLALREVPETVGCYVRADYTIEF